MKNFLSFLILLFTAFGGQLLAQDQIYTTDGQVIQASILEIGEEKISYRNYGRPDGPLYVISKNSVQKIIFESGIEETFNHTGQQIEINNDGTNKDDPKVKEPDRIYLVDGKVIECEVVEKKRFGINYIPVSSQNNYVEYISNTKVDKIVYGEGDVEYVSGSPNNTRKTKDPRDFSYLSPHYVSLNVGPGIPFGAFGSSQGGGSGFASTGFDVHADVTYYIFRGLGFSATLGYLYNPFNDAALRQIVNTKVPQTATDLNISIGEWQHIYFLGGVGYYNDFNRLILEYKAMGGLLYSMYPTSVATYTEGGDSYVRRFTDNSVSFVFGGNSGFRYFITRKWSVKGSITMLFGKATFDGLVQSEYKNGVYQGDQVATGVSEQPVAWININVGVAYTLGK